MKAAPALTWLHLLPGGTSLECGDAPAWFGELSASAALSGDRGTALVFFNAVATRILAEARGFDARAARQLDAAAHAAPDQAPAAGPADRIPAAPPTAGAAVVAVNCLGFSAPVFQYNDFAYARRFAVVPDLEHARMFIPMDNGAVSAAGFELYSPAKFSSRLKRAAAQLAARVGFGGWHRDEIWIAARQTPPLEKLAARLFPGREFRLALSAGAPEPARNRKCSVAVLAMDGTPLAFAKLPGSELATRLVRREADVLCALARRFSGEGGVVPRLLHAGEDDGQYALFQSPLPGTPTSPKLAEPHRRFLHHLRFPGERRPASASGFFQELRARVGALGEESSDLRRALDRVLPALDALIVPRTIIHGDFAPWNIRLQPGGKTIGVYDWEYGQLDGLPLIDDTHFLLQNGLLLNDWPVERAVQALGASCHREPDYRPEQVRALQAVYCVDSIARLLEEGYAADDEMLLWYRAVLRHGPAAEPHWPAHREKPAA
jgi:hypothetical protein